VEMFRHSQRSVRELHWNYAMVLEVLEEKRPPVALTGRLRQLLPQLRELAEL
jgi:hypothetical protein